MLGTVVTTGNRTTLAASAMQSSCSAPQYCRKLDPGPGSGLCARALVDIELAGELLSFDRKGDEANGVSGRRKQLAGLVALVAAIEVPQDEGVADRADTRSCGHDPQEVVLIGSAQLLDACHRLRPGEFAICRERPF